MTQFSTRNISMMMDLYEMTMANGYFAHHETQPKVIFDIFVKIIFFVIIIPPFLDFVDLILDLFQPFVKGRAKTFPLFEKSGAKTFIKINYLVRA